MCDELINELKKCLANKNTINIRQLTVIQEPDLMDDIDTEYIRIKINVYEVNNRLFNYGNKREIKECLKLNKLGISNEDYPHATESVSYYNNITIKKIE